VTEIAFRLNGREMRAQVRDDARLLDVLREDLRLTGAKEGCGKGECGACTVLLDGQAVDSCLTMAWQADGHSLETIEGLASGDRLHPLQEAFVAHGGVQCGICIPGMVLAAKAAMDSGLSATDPEIRQALAGNLCRCTGYTKIVSAVCAVAGAAAAAPPAPAPPPLAPSSLRPRTLAEALQLLGERRPLAGGTDLLVKAKDGHADLGALFDLSAVAELHGIEETEAGLRIGAASTHTELMSSEAVRRLAPALPVACAVIGGPQIRNRGTIGGNLANASPAADTAPALYVADAVVEIASPRGRREVPIDAFFSGPRRSVLAEDELIVAVRVPRALGVRATFLRLGQRRAQAISKVSVAVALQGPAQRPTRVRIAFGAVAPTVIRAPRAEAELLSGGISALDRAVAAACEEVRPIDDIRSTRGYRRQMAGVLLRRAVLALR
jgi:carbon-monoxide dehydrogenase small subunit/xanthine dehydrogenase small subunit